MNDLKNKVPTKLLWIDLEMTGLDPQQDVILEIAAEVTDFNLKTLESYEALLKQPREVVVERMQASNPFWREVPEARDFFLANLDKGKQPKQVVLDLVAIVDRHFKDELAVIAGNSIHNDREFIKYWWPSLELKLHYRMLDVSSFKVMMQGKYGEIYEKKEPHRAYEDVQASIAELQHYIDFFNRQ